jgi:2-keto-4-pentenoate hydratase/2-oxohepta-3-ene-1,7-dioic acid hydratase in catechol pathway
LRLVAFATGGQSRIGLWRDDGIVDLSGRLGSTVRDLGDVVRTVRYERLAEIEAAAGVDFAHDAVTLAKPLERWGKCFCVGVNYPERNEEYKDGSAPPQYPSLFVRFPESFVGPDAPILRPPESEQLDYEGEIVLVIGKAGRRIPPETALDHVWGVTIANEGSIRDWLRHAKFNVTQGKNFAQSGSLGPWLVPLSDLPSGPLRVITRVNGEVRQDDTTDRMIFPFDRIIAYISTFATLEPGDIILTGTPSGAGARFVPPRYLKAGDVVEVEVTGIGTLRNPVADEGTHG